MQASVAPTQTHRWIVDPYGYDIEHGRQAFFLWIYAAGEGSGGFNTVYFNITRPSQRTVSVTISPTTRTDSPISSLTPSPTSSTTSAPTFFATTLPTPPQERPSLNTSAKVAVGIGIAVGVLGSIIGGVALFLMRRNRKGNAEQSRKDPAYTQAQHYTYRAPMEYSFQRELVQIQGSEIQELDALDQSLGELPTKP